MVEIRCKKCNRLLMKAEEPEIDISSAPYFEERDIEIKCPKCGYLHKDKI
jgi:phage FluMu protein Com